MKATEGGDRGHKQDTAQLIRDGYSVGDVWVSSCYNGHVVAK